MKSIPVLLLMLCVLTIHAQEDNIKRNAIFASFEEFKNNTPSVYPVNLFLEQETTDKFTLKYYDSTGELKKYKQPFWGFSDSNEVYIRYKGFIGRFMAIGKVCVFKYFEDTRTVNSMTPNGHMMRRTYSVEKEHIYVLDPETGNISILKPSLVKKLIKDDQELSNEYNQEGEYNQDRDKLTYLRKYNQRKVQH